MTTQSIKKQILPILKRQGVAKAALFGSCGRGKMKKRSDIDLLVNLKKDKTLLDLNKNIPQLKKQISQLLEKF